MQTVPIPRLTLALADEAFTGFASLFQHGILFAVEQPVALLPFLLSVPGFTAEYIENAVQTIFINGVAADRLDRVLTGGSTLALSAAMPGLAGAIFRRQGLHGSLRSQPGEKKDSGQSASGFIKLKLFNSIATDRVHDLLTHGIQVTGKALHSFAAKREHFFQPPTSCDFVGQDIRHAELLAVVAGLPLLMVKANLLPKS